MRKKIALILSFLLVVAVSVSCADMRSGVSLVAGYVSWARYFGIPNFEMSYSFETGDTADETKILCDRLTVADDRGTLEARYASLLYYELNEKEEYKDLLNRFYALIGAVEFGMASAVDPSSEKFFFQKVATSLFDTMEIEETSILLGNEVEFYASDTASYFVTFQQKGVYVIARPKK